MHLQLRRRRPQADSIAPSLPLPDLRLEDRRRKSAPHGAFVVVVYGIVAKYGLDGLFMCTLMAGVMLVILAPRAWGPP